MIPLGQLILWFICFGFAFGFEFEFSGAALFALLAKGAVFDVPLFVVAGLEVAFRLNIPSPKRPVYPPAAGRRDHPKTGLTASRISPPTVPCYEWRILK